MCKFGLQSLLDSMHSCPAQFKNSASFYTYLHNFNLKPTKLITILLGIILKNLEKSALSAEWIFDQFCFFFTAFGQIITTKSNCETSYAYVDLIDEDI